MPWSSTPETVGTAPDAPGRAARRRQQAAARPADAPRWAAPWLGMLALVLALQIGLAVRLLRSNTAFSDEALYLYAGHDEIAHLLHGAVIGNYQTYFSGAPTIYPVLGAMADSVGGLLAARLLGLAFMLGATVLLYDAAGRLFDRRTGLLAAALFVVAGPTQFLSAFATYDPMALFLLVLAGWLAVRAAGSVPWLLASGLALALSDATKYAAALWDPVVLALAVLPAVERYRWRGALLRGAVLLAELVLLLGGAVLLAGHWYQSGIESTTLKRAVGTTPRLRIMDESWHWVGLIWVGALLALVLLLAERQRHRRLVAAVLVLAVMLAPINQARIQVTTSLHKHVDFGAWFAAVLAGYLLSRLLATAKGRAPLWQGAAVAAIVGFALYCGLGQVGSLYQRGWPDATGMVAALRGQLRPGEPILAENDPVPRYYLRAQTTWQQWTSTWNFSYRDPVTHRTYSGDAAYQKAIEAHYFGVVELDHVTTPGLDVKIVAAMMATPGYRKAAGVSGVHQGVDYSVWVYRPKAAATSSGH
ncbi:hypothetical protein GXW83_29775 [Streptacidiphilus sp. PB12-B1b]|uniref:glycosyltransferase family 39 protein n=1 Tax=Streptacidiphilus sp. PB12-B1b TaxID=2705012 RepID=UPI0015FE2220|nr:glycosyltransferase family 39 protein [Streptacidiphilus sp. PB12-B1b]QMU79273.1 hypothetical protein GXW83_29775 [Streptacidiphilus sp. PB12-B1b]